jgi:lipoyl(octanoyl) transferase
MQAAERPTAPSDTGLEIVRPGRVSYARALQRQRETADRLRRGEGPETLFLLEHPPTVTLGRRAKTDDNLRLSRAAYTERGITVVETDRGGDVTFHGPGQVIGYPILDLRRRRSGPRAHLHFMEEVLIRALGRFAIEAFRDDEHIGVWTKEGKIAAMGIRVSAGVSLHGFALNVAADLDSFGLIVPCGIVGRPVASMHRVLGEPVELGDVMDAIEEEFRALSASALENVR